MSITYSIEFSQSNLKVMLAAMGARQGDSGPLWILKHGTDIVYRGLKVLFFGLFLLFFGIFSVAPSLLEANSAIFGIFC